VARVGVIVAVIVVSVYAVVAMFVLVEVVALTTCNTLPPPAGAAHLSPVLSELSATNLIQEQSQRIVLGA
jgi:hypothetical protein